LYLCFVWLSNLKLQLWIRKDNKGTSGNKEDRKSKETEEQQLGEKLNG
jgi:hypothetical protein